MTEELRKAKREEFRKVCCMLHDVKQHAIHFGEYSEGARMGHVQLKDQAKAEDTAMEAATDELLNYINQIIEEN